MSEWKARPVHLHNLDGRKIKAESISEFCRRAKLGGNAKLHITPVLNRERWHYKGWHLPRKDNITVRDINGNTYRVTNVLLFAKKNKLNIYKLMDFIEGKCPIYRGLCSSTIDINAVRPPKRKIVLTKEGRTMTFKTGRISAKCKDIPLCRRAIYYASHGQTSYRGWRVKSVELIPNPIKKKLFTV